MRYSMIQLLMTAVMMNFSLVPSALIVFNRVKIERVSYNQSEIRHA